MSCEMFPQGEYLLHRTPFNVRSFKRLVDIDRKDSAKEGSNITPAEVFQVYERILTKFGEPFETTMSLATTQEYPFEIKVHYQGIEGFQCPKIVFWAVGNLDMQDVDLGRSVPKEDPPIKDMDLFLGDVYKDGNRLSVVYRFDPDKIVMGYHVINNSSIRGLEELVSGSERLTDLVNFAKFLENTFKTPKTIGLVRAVYNTSRVGQILGNWILSFKTS
ncbi:hypothetical protein HYW46_05375 [Candidatus Daviesbacteria bacterium]|nr:hypothetical protein [Candidatus Daviesbacteria bacterium]